MKRTIFREQNGQVLVQVALMILVLLLFVGLAVDVGNIYGERRHMQNAADAGALAGAREICFGDPPDPIGQARRYAIDENGADEADVRVIDVYKVEVVASVAAETYFIRLIPGLETVDVSAIAVAGCGEGEGVCHGFPVAFHVDLWCTVASLVGCPPPSLCGETGVDPICGDLDPSEDTPCDEHITFYIWDDEVLTDYYIPEDILGDDSPEHVIGSGHRRWLDFGKPDSDLYPSECGGCGNIKCLIEHGYAGPVEIGDCVSAKPGVAATFLKNTPPQIVPIPVYEETCSGAEGCGGDGIVVLDFACIDIIGAVEIHWEGHKHRLVEFKVICDTTSCPNPCARTDGEAPGPGAVTGVSLLR